MRSITLGKMPVESSCKYGPTSRAAGIHLEIGRGLRLAASMKSEAHLGALVGTVMEVPRVDLFSWSLRWALQICGWDA